MLRRLRGGKGSSDGETVFLALRSNILSLDPSSVGIAPSAELPQVFAFLMDMPSKSGFATIVAVADGTTSMYTSTGGGIIGAGPHEGVARANRLLLMSAEANLDELVDRGEPTVPAPGRVRLTAVTFGGPRSVVADTDDLAHRRHPAAPVFHAADRVITELRRLDEAAKGGGGGGGPQDDSLTRLMVATRARDPKLVAHLLELGDDVNARDGFGHTALMFAAHGGREDIVGMLLAHGADPDAADAEGHNALAYAERAGQAGSAALLR